MDITNLIERILSGPSDPDKEFVPAVHTYADVYAMAAWIASRFSSPEAGGRPVCVCSEDRGIIAASMLASLAGGPVCILPYSLSEQVIGETRAAVPFSHAIVDSPADLPDDVAGIVPGRGLWRPPSAGRARDLNSIFLRMFTGGSTGKPKAWSKTPVNMFAEAGYQAEKYGFSRDDLVASTVPPYHIYGLLYTVMAPFIGSSSVLEGTYVYPHEIAAVLKEKPVSILVSVPVHYRIVNGVAFDASRLRLAFSSAGPLDPSDGAAFHRQTGVGPEEIFGSTETGGIACKSSAVGRTILEPFECLEWKISDDRLCVKSPFVSPDLPVDGDGFFVTGDRIAAAGDGRFTLLGRADGVIKVGGKRVDLNSVQDKIKLIPGVRDAFLFSLRGRAGRGADIAAVVETDMDETELRRLFNGVLEQYAMPRRLRIVDKIPTTSTGKYDREAITKLLEFDRKQREECDGR
ncbi:MAG: acyl--CoA ligase [Spirochaetes bacterium]|nr:acyl--CoA ligase [Spirochaetota bacterium]